MKLLLVLATLALSCASPDGARVGSTSADGSMPPGWTLDAATSDAIHTTSGFRFAATRNGCTRLTPHDFDATGENASVGYQCPSGVWLTAYVYPRAFGGAPDPAEHFEGVIGDVFGAHPTAELKRAAEMQLPLGARTLPGFTAYLEWIAEESEVGSFAVLVPDGPRFAKIRTSFPLASTSPPIDEAWRLTLDVLRWVGAGE